VGGALAPPFDPLDVLGKLDAGEILLDGGPCV
jgi:hypothetical protein